MEKRGALCLKIGVVCLGVASLVILFMPFVANQSEKENNVWAYMLALLFWFATVAGYLFFYKAKSFFSGLGKKRKIKKFPIANTKVGFIWNILFLISIVGYLLTQVLFVFENIFGYMFISLFVLSFHMQILFNSETFIIYISLQNRKVEDHG